MTRSSSLAVERGPAERAPFPVLPSLVEGADALAAHGGVAGPDHCTVAIVRVLAAVEGVDHPVVGCCKETVVPFLAEQPVGAAVALSEIVSPPARP